MHAHAHAHAHARPHAHTPPTQSHFPSDRPFPHVLTFWQMGSTWRARNIHPARAYPMRDSPGNNLPIAARISPAFRERESKVCRLSAGEVYGDYSNGNSSTMITAWSVYTSCTHTADQSSPFLPSSPSLLRHQHAYSISPSLSLSKVCTSSDRRTAPGCGLLATSDPRSPLHSFWSART